MKSSGENFKVEMVEGKMKTFFFWRESSATRKVFNGKKYQKKNRRFLKCFDQMTERERDRKRQREIECEMCNFGFVLLEGLKDSKDHSNKLKNSFDPH
jgi:hypothetical protein